MRRWVLYLTRLELRKNVDAGRRMTRPKSIAIAKTKSCFHFGRGTRAAVASTPVNHQRWPEKQVSSASSAVQRRKRAGFSYPGSLSARRTRLALLSLTNHRYSGG